MKNKGRMKKREQFLFWEKCWTCGEWKLRGKMLWRFNKKGLDYWEAQCRECQSKTLHDDNTWQEDFIPDEEKHQDTIGETKRMVAKIREIVLDIENNQEWFDTEYYVRKLTLVVLSEIDTQVQIAREMAMEEGFKKGKKVSGDLERKISKLLNDKS